MKCRLDGTSQVPGGTGLIDWRSLDFDGWNDLLVRHCFLAAPGEQATVVRRIVATPEELGRLCGAMDESGSVVEAFVDCVKAAVGGTDYCTWCYTHAKCRHWTSSSATFPPHFAVLWLTCLIASGYPDDEGGFHDRTQRVLGQASDCVFLPRRWEDVQRWLESAAPPDSVGTWRQLVLPPSDNLRTRIGVSWFLAYPHARDRATLSKVLGDAGLLGDEPPVISLLDALKLNLDRFTKAFREDFGQFVTRFQAGEDPRGSAFWDAVCYAASIGAGETAPGRGDLALSATLVDGRLEIYVAAAPETDTPQGYKRETLDFDLDGYDAYLTDVGQAVAAALTGDLRVPKVAVQATRGVLVFAEVLSGEYRLVGGSDAQDGTQALVRADRVPAFTRHFGGRERETQEWASSKWHHIDSCNVVVGDAALDGLEGVYHLLRTASQRSLSFVGGIRVGRGFLALENWLPSIHSPGAAAVCLRNRNGAVLSCEPREGVADDWSIPAEATKQSDREFTAQADYGDETAEKQLSLIDPPVGCEYKGLPQGQCVVEGRAEAQDEMAGCQPVLSGLEVDEDPEADLLSVDPDVWYLGADVGAGGPEREEGWDWAVVGPPNRPRRILFIGDREAPAAATERCSNDAGDRRRWRRFVCQKANGVAPEDQDLFEALRSRAHSNPRAEDSTFEPRQHLPQGQARARGVAEVPRELVDIVQAVSLRRSGLRYAETMDWVAEVLRVKREAGHAVIRAWQEAGLVDVAYKMGFAGQMVVARQPRFVAWRVGGLVKATLVGLVPVPIREPLQRALNDAHAQEALVQTSCAWLPPVMRYEVDRFETLARVSDEYGLGRPSWLDWPACRDAAAGALADPAARLQRAQLDGLAATAVWDWGAARFVGVEVAGQTEEAGVRLEYWPRPQRCAVYMVLRQATPIGWSFVRSRALHAAYHLARGGRLFRVEDGVASLDAPPELNLPLSAARLCAVLGAGLTGPELGADGAVVGWRYPFGPRLATELLSVHY